MIPVTVDDLAANGLLGEADPQACWERSVETLTARKDDIAGLAVASDERIEAYLLYVRTEWARSGRRRGDRVAPLVHRGRWSPSEATALSTPRARHEDLPVPEGPPGGDLDGVPGDARFPPRRRASPLRSDGAVRLSDWPPGDFGGGYVEREGLPRHRRRRRVQSPRAGCRAARPHHRRARRGAPSRGRGLRQGRSRQEHVDAASRGRSARPGASDCDPGRGLQRPLAGAHGRCPGSAVRARQRQGRAPADQRTGSRSSRWAR